jgi:glycosyltransferase involved in cell wall biosynthesis
MDDGSSAGERYLERYRCRAGELGLSFMRVGVVTRDPAASEGGGHTFISSLVEAISTATSSHTFLFHDTAPIQRDRPRRRLIRRAGDAIGAGRLVDAAARHVGRWERRFGDDEISPLERFVKESEIDIVWFLSPGGGPVSAPYIATVWDLQHRLQPYFPEVSTTGWDWDARERHYRSTLPQAARIVTGTETGKNQIVQFYGVNPENVAVVPLPVADAEPGADRGGAIDVRAKYGIARKFVFYPAQFWPHKNHVNLLLAFDLLRRDRGLELDLVLTGSDKGNLDHVTETVALLGLTARVHIPGFVPKAELRAFYRHAMGLVYPSFFGPDNIPPLEAFALGCPVAAARVAGAEEQLGDAALLFDPADPADIARAISMLQERDELRAELIRRGRALVATRTARSYVAQICRVVDELAPFRRTWGRRYLHS